MTRPRLVICHRTTFRDIFRDAREEKGANVCVGVRYMCDGGIGGINKKSTVAALR